MKRKIGVVIFLIVMSSTVSNSQQIDTAALQNLVDKRVDNKQVFGVQLTVKKGDQIWSSSAGNLSVDQPVFIASTTKIYVTAMVLRLVKDNKLNLDDFIGQYLSDDIMTGLHVYEGKDYSNELTIRHLLSHTSGLPDYFEGKDKEGKILLEELKKGNDMAWTFEELIGLSKQMKPKFKPGKKKKALYSDTNFQLLGKIIEKVTGRDFDEALNELVIEPLDLKNTYMYRDPGDRTPAEFYFKKEIMSVPKAMSSFGPDGGMVSTSAEMMVFLTAFFEGKLFPKEYLPELYKWNKIFFPLQNGVGMMRFKMIFQPEYIGHSGLCGAFAFYVPEDNVYMCGTVNQLHKPGTSYQFMSKVRAKLR